MIWRNAGPYFTDMRTNRKWPIDDMSWDNGLLVANEEKDGAILGSFEFNIALEAQKDRHELQPVPKIIQPVDPSTQLYELPASSGTY